MTLESTIDHLLYVGNHLKEEKIAELINNLFTVDASLADMQKGFDKTLRANVITRDEMKVEILLVLHKRITDKSQLAEFTWPPTGLRTKIKDLKQFALDIQKCQYSNIGKLLYNVLER